MADCWHLKSNNQGSTKLTMTTVKAQGHCGKETRDSMSSCESALCDEYKPFISQSYVCLPGSTTKTPITILRDTGTNQSLLLKSTLPLSKQTFTGAEVLIQSVDLGPIRVLRHEVELQSNLVSGLVIVGVRPSLPVEGLSLILGNDLVGGKVTADPCVTNQPTIPDGMKEAVIVYPACAVTRAIARREAEEDGVITSPITTTCGFTEENSLVADNVQKISKDSEERDALVTVSETFVVNKPDASRSQGSGSPSQQHSLPCNTDKIVWGCCQKLRQETNTY